MDLNYKKITKWSNTIRLFVQENIKSDVLDVQIYQGVKHTECCKTYSRVV